MSIAQAERNGVHRFYGQYCWHWTYPFLLAGPRYLLGLR